MNTDLIKVMGLCTMLALPTAALATESDPAQPNEETPSLIELAADEEKDKKGEKKDGQK